MRMWQSASHGCQGHTSDVVRLQDRHGDIGLDTYMRLPVQHYYELDPGLIKPLGGRAFALKVPRVSVSLPSAPCARSRLHLLITCAHKSDPLASVGAQALMRLSLPGVLRCTH